MPQSTYQKSRETEHTIRERPQEEQTKRAWTEKQKDNNPHRAEATSKRPLQSPRDPRGLSPSKLDIEKDNAIAHSSHQGPIEMFDAPAVEKIVLQHHRNQPKPISHQPKPIFHISLDDLYQRDGIAVPKFLTQCFIAVERFGLAKKKIYGVTASYSDLDWTNTAFETSELEESFHR